MNHVNDLQQFLLAIGFLAALAYYGFVIGELLSPEYTNPHRRTKKVFKASFFIPAYLWVLILLDNYKTLE